jgi:hypothetical protein
MGLCVRIPPETWMLVSCECCVLCCLVDVSASGWSLVQRSPTEHGVSKWVKFRNPLNKESGPVEVVQAQRKNPLSQSSWHYPGIILFIRFVEGKIYAKYRNKKVNKNWQSAIFTSSIYFLFSSFISWNWHIFASCQCTFMLLCYTAQVFRPALFV